MNYDQALSVIAETGGGLVVDPHDPAVKHINVRKKADGPPFSIYLPDSGDHAQDVDLMILALASARLALP